MSYQSPKLESENLCQLCSTIPNISSKRTHPHHLAKVGQQLYVFLPQSAAAVKDQCQFQGASMQEKPQSEGSDHLQVSLQDKEMVFQNCSCFWLRFRSIGDSSSCEK
eukprot:Gb_40279 [translate_table: standard]